MRTSSRSNNLRFRTLLVGSGIAVLAMAGASCSSTAAGPPETTTEQYAFESWDCGYPLQIEGEVTSRFLTRPNPRGGPILAQQNVDFSETWTNSDEEQFTLSGRFLAKDMSATPLGGTLYEVTVQQSGQPFVISVDGEVLVRDRGNLRLSFRTDPESGFFEFLGASVSGPHAGFDTDLCKLVAPIVGSDSADRHTPRPLGTTAAGMGYYEYLPPSYGKGGSPLLVVANGYGENGDGSAERLDWLLFTGIPRFIDVGGWPVDRPFVVLSTQHIEAPPGLSTSCEDGVWFGSCWMQAQHDQGHPPQSPCTTPDELHAFIDYAVANYDIDPARVYVTGLSCGAFGTWEYLGEYGDEQVAAAVPIAGDGRPMWGSIGCGLSEVPVWGIHGDEDVEVSPWGTIDTIEALRTCPGVTEETARLSVYEGVDHNAWDPAYSGAGGDDIYSWMLSYTRP